MRHPMLTTTGAGPWAMERRALRELLYGARMHEDDLFAGLYVEELEEADDPHDEGYVMVGGVAVFEIRGVIMEGAPRWARRYGLATDPMAVRTALTQAEADRTVESHFAYADSPGGYTDGVQELADAFFEAEKPTTGHIANIGASAAYEIASQMDVLTANEDARVGSIGVYVVLDDWSKAFEQMGVETLVLRSGKYKGTGIMGAEITDEELEPLQEMVNDTAELFISRVARGRNMGVSQVAELATGRTWLAAKAEKRNLIDRVANADDSLAAALELTQDSDAEVAMGGFKNRLAGLLGRSDETDEPDEIEETEETPQTPAQEEDEMGDETQETAADTGKGRLIAIREAFAEFGPQADTLASDCFCADLTAEQAQAVAGSLASLLEDAESADEELQEKLEAAEGRVEELEAENEGLTQRLGEGNEVVDGGPGQDPGSKAEQFEQKVEEKQKEDDCKRGEAMRAVRDNHPDLHEAWHAAQNE